MTNITASSGELEYPESGTYGKNETKCWRNHAYDFRPNCTLFISIISVINQSYNGTFKVHYGQRRDKNSVNIFKVSYLIQ